VEENPCHKILTALNTGIPPLSAFQFDAIPQVSLGTAALVIFAACAVLAFARGLARLALGTGMLALSGWAGFWMWRNAPALAGTWMPNPPAWFSAILTTAVALATFFLLRIIVATVTRPAGGNPAPTTPQRGLLPRSLRLLLSLLPATLLCFLGAAFVRHLGSVADLRDFALRQAGVDPGGAATFLTSLKDHIDRSLPADWFRVLDPVTDEARLLLAKQITARASGEREPAIDPATGQVIPRAIIVDDPQLQEMARHGRFSEILRDPRLDAALADPKIRRSLRQEAP
jgi:hypothetical protein